MKIYISHTAECSGWDMDKIYKGTLFNKGARTNAVKNKAPAESDVKMLDWDFRGWMKSPDKIKDDHLQNTKDYNFDVVMSMDLWADNQAECFAYTDELQKYADRVLIPAHAYPKELMDYQIAYPNANWFASNTFPPADFRDNITHILGGSPQSQLDHLTTTQKDLFGNDLRFKKVESIDGNQIFNVAIRAGKEWYPTRPYWRKAKVEIPNEQIFSNSIHKLDQVVKTLF